MSTSIEQNREKGLRRALVVGIQLTVVVIVWMSIVSNCTSPSSVYTTLTYLVHTTHSNSLSKTVFNISKSWQRISNEERNTCLNLTIYYQVYNSHNCFQPIHIITHAHYNQYTLLQFLKDFLSFSHLLSVFVSSHVKRFIKK